MQDMTSVEFIAKLGKTKRNWHGIDRIRRGTSGELTCPITDVCNQVTGKFYSISNWVAAAKLLGLSRDFARDVFDAADNNYGCDGELRQKILVATNLNT